MACCSLSVRAAIARDLPALSALTARAFQSALTQARADRGAALASALIRPQPVLLAMGQYVVAERAGVLVAAGGWGHETPWGHPAPQGIGHLCAIMSDPAEHGQGHGRAILHRCLDHAHSQGIAVLHGHVLRSAVGFYCAAGFEAAAEVDLHLARGVVLRGAHVRIRLGA